MKMFEVHLIKCDPFNMSEKLIVSWEGFEKTCSQLADKIKLEYPQVNCLVGIARGGLAPLTYFSQLLNIKEISIISVKSYEGEHKQKQTFLFNPNTKMAFWGKNVLLIDDICDTGDTITMCYGLLYGKCTELKTVTPYYKPKSSKYKPDFYSEETESWVQFPWEKNNG